MTAPQPITNLYTQLTSIGKQCGLRENEFAIVDDSVLVDGEELVKRQLDIAKVVLRFTEPYVGVTVVLPGVMQQAGSLKKPIIAAGGSCYFRTPIESFEQVVELARARMQRSRLAAINMAEGEVAEPSKNGRNPEELRGYSYTSEEQAALRKAYESDAESGSVLS